MSTDNLQSMSAKSSQHPEKWAVPEKEWEKMAERLLDVLHDYEMRGFCLRGDVTRDEMRAEFFERLGEFCGLKINKCRHDVPLKNRCFGCDPNTGVEDRE